MRFGIIANPKSGQTSVARKSQTLGKVGDILGSDSIIAGLDTTSRDEFIQAARELAEKVDVLVVAGGDGTFSDVINAVDPETVLSYLPQGSGCALRYALGMPPQLTRVAKQIKEGRLRRLDLILCDESIKAFIASVGLEGDILHRREALEVSGIHGPPAYAMATFGLFFADLERTHMTITVDGQTLIVSDAVTAIITKVPYYGYKMKVVPNAVFDDGKLHLLAVNSGWSQIVQNLASAFIDENKMGTYRSGREIELTTSHERHAQTDGTLYRTGTSFRFRVLPGALQMRY